MRSTGEQSAEVRERLFCRQFEEDGHGGVGEGEDCARSKEGG